MVVEVRGIKRTDVDLIPSFSFFFFFLSTSRLIDRYLIKIVLRHGTRR